MEHQDTATAKMSRKRMPTLTFDEQEFLLDTLDEFKTVVESKKNDVRSISKKERAWKEIESRFCAKSGFNKRDSTQLKKCWNNLKMKAKKSVAREKRDRKKKGGGNIEPSDETSQKICAIIPDQMHPLDNNFDNDADFHLNKDSQDASATDGSDDNECIEKSHNDINTILPSGSGSRKGTGRQSITSSFASAKVDLVSMAKEEHDLKMKLLQTQISAAEQEHQAKMSILYKQEYLIDLQTQNESSMNRQKNTTPTYYETL